jgi:hypothetical protein
MDKKKLAAILLLVAMGLSALGVVYAAWIDLIYITGYVEMGSLTLAFDTFEPPFCQEFHLPPTGPPLVPGEWLGKDVADCYATYRADSYVYDEHTDKDGYKIMDIFVYNAYPQLYVHTTFIVHNIGTVPIMLAEFQITGEKEDSAGNEVCKLLWYDPDFDGVGEIYEDYNANGVVDDQDILVINLVVVNGFPIQLDSCNTNKMEIDMDFKQEAQECHHYYLHVNLIGIQWNKYSEYYP